MLPEPETTKFHTLLCGALSQEASLQHLWPSPEATASPKDRRVAVGARRDTRLHQRRTRPWNLKSTYPIMWREFGAKGQSPRGDKTLDIPLGSGVRVPPRPFWLHAGWMHDLPLQAMLA